MTRTPRRPRGQTALFLGGAMVGACFMYAAINRFLNRDLLKGYTAGYGAPGPRLVNDGRRTTGSSPQHS